MFNLQNLGAGPNVAARVLPVEGGDFYVQMRNLDEAGAPWSNIMRFVHDSGKFVRIPGLATNLGLSLDSEDGDIQEQDYL